MTSRYLKKHYKKEEVLSYSHAIKTVYRFLFEEFSPRKIFREKFEQSREAGTFRLTRQKRRKIAYFALSWLFHLFCFFFADYYQRHHTPPPLVVADASFDQSAIQLVSISSATHKNIKTSGGKPKDSPQEKNIQGVPKKRVRTARAEKPVLTPPTPDNFLNKIFRRAIKSRSSSRTQKFPNTQTRKMELARAQQSKNLPVVERKIKAQKPAPPRKTIATKKAIKKLTPAKPLPAPQKLVKKKTPLAKPQETRPAKPAIDQVREIAKAMARAKTEAKVKTPTPRKIEMKKTTPKTPQGKKLAYETKTKKILRQPIKQPVRPKQVSAPRKTATQKVVKKTATKIKPVAARPVKPVITQVRKTTKTMARAKTEAKVKTPTPRKIEMKKTAAKTPQGKKLAYQPKKRKVTKRAIKQPVRPKQVSAPRKTATQKVVKKTAAKIKPVDARPAKPVITQQRKIAKAMAQAKTEAKVKTPTPRKIETKKTAPKTPQGKKLAYEPKTKKTLRQPIKQPARPKQVSAPRKTATQKVVKKAATKIKPVAARPAKPAIDQERKIAKTMAKAKTETSVKTPTPRKIGTKKTAPKTPQGKKLAYEPKTKKAVNQPARPYKPADEIKPQKTREPTLTALLVHKTKGDTPSRLPAAPSRSAPQQGGKKSTAVAVIPSPKGPQKTKEVSLKKQSETIKTTTQRLEYEITQQVRKAEDIPRTTPVKASPIKPRAIPVAGPARKAVTRTIAKAALQTPAISPKPAQKTAPANPLLLAEGGDQSFTVELVQKPRTVAKIRQDYQGSKALSAPSSRQPHLPRKPEDLEDFLEHSPKLGLVASAKRKKLTTRHKTSLAEKTKEFRLEHGPKKERKTKVQYTQSQTPRTEELQKKLSYEKSNISPEHSVIKRVSTHQAKSSVTSRSVRGPENLSQKTTTLLEPTVARDMVAKATRKTAPHKKIKEFPLQQKDFSLPIEMTPAPDKAVQVAVRSPSSPKESIESKDIQYSKTTAPKKIKHQFRLQYKTQSTLRAEREITGPDVIAREPALSEVPDIKTPPSLQIAAKTQTAISNNDIVSLNREESHHIDGPSYRKKDKILRDAPEAGKARTETVKVKLVAMTSPKSFERPVKIRAEKIRYRQEEQINIRRFEGNFGDVSMQLTGQQTASLDAATKKVIQPSTIRNIRRPFMPDTAEYSPSSDKKTTPTQETKRGVLVTGKDLVYAEHRTTTAPAQQEKQTVSQTSFSKPAQIIQKLKQVLFNIYAPQEKMAATPTRTATQVAAVEKIRGKLSSLMVKEQVTPDRDFAEAEGTIKDITGQKTLDFKEKGVETAEIEQERLDYDVAQTTVRSPTGPDVSGLEETQIQKRADTQTLAGVEKQVTQVAAHTGISAQADEISPEQDIARELLVAQMAAQIVREMMGEKGLEYAAAETTAKKVKQQRVEYEHKTAEVTERGSAGPDVTGMEDVQLQEQAETGDIAVVEKKVIQITPDLPTQMEGREITPEQDIARELLVAQMAAQIIREMMGDKDLEYATAETAAEKVEQERMEYEHKTATVAERESTGPDVSGIEETQLQQRAETQAIAGVEKQVTQVAAHAGISAQVNEITPEQDIARELMVSRMAANVIREMMGEKGLEYAATETTAKKVDQERMKLDTASVSKRSGATPDVSGIKETQIQKRADTQTLAGMEKKVTRIAAHAEIPTQAAARDITPEMEKELLVARLTSEVVEKMWVEKMLELTTAKTVGSVEQERVQYSGQPTIKHTQGAPEIPLEEITQDEVADIGKHAPVTQARPTVHPVSQARRTEQANQEIDWTAVTKAVSLYIEKALEKGIVNDAEAAPAPLRDAPTAKELGYQAKITAPSAVSQQRVRYEPESSARQQRLSENPQLLQGDQPEIMTQAKGVEPLEKVERVHTTAHRQEKVPIMADDFLRQSAVPVATVEKESPDALLGESEVKTHAIEREFQYQKRKETHDKVQTEQKRVRYQNMSNQLSERATPAPENIVSRAEELKELSGEMASRSTNNLTSIAKKTFTYKEQIDAPLIRSSEFSKIDAQKSLSKKQYLDNAISSITGRQGKSLQQKQMAMVDRKKIDSSFTPGIKQGKKGVQAMDSIVSRPGAEKKKDLLVSIERPFSNMTRHPLYTLKGSIDKSVKLIFVAINEVTQMVPVIDGEFSAKLSMSKGINRIDVLGYNSSGGIGQVSTKILFNPRMPVPVVKLLSPQNGQQGMREGDAVLIKGTVNDPRITKATLFINNIPIKIKVINGVFKRKIFMPRGRVITFRVKTTNRTGGVGYSPMHTILAGYEIDIINPRPY